MRQWRIASLSSAVAVLTSLLLVEPVGAQIFSGRQQSRLIGQGQNSGNWFSVMGHIERPATYELPTSSPSLVDFVRFAGGLKKTATNRIRIVRNGRDGNQSWFSPKSTVRLLPGDLVVFDGQITGGRIFRGGSARTKPDGPIQIGLVGVLDYPIVMRVEAASATVQWVTAQLGQSPEIADSVRILAPVRRGQPGPDTVLADNTVLVFNSQQIDRSRLPRLPVPVSTQAPRPPQSDDAGANREDSAREESGRPRDQQSARPEQQFNPLPYADRPGFASTRNAARDGGQAADGRPRADGTPDADNIPPGKGMDPEVVKDILTHPDSVELDSRPVEQPGRTRVSDSGSARVNRSGDSGRHNGSPAADPSDRSGLPDEPMDPSQLAALKPPVPQTESPEAVRPFESVPDETSIISESQPLPAGPIPARPIEIDGSLPTRSPDADAGTPAATAPIPDSTRETTSTPPPVAIERQPAAPGQLGSDSKLAPVPDTSPARPSLSSEAVLPHADSTVIRTPTGPERTGPEAATLPSLSPDDASLGDAVVADILNAGRNSDRHSGNVDEIESRSIPAADLADSTKETGSAHADRIGADKTGTQVIPRKPERSHWPLVLVGVIGGIAGVYAVVMLFVMGGRPAPSNPTVEARNERYWLERIIRNELPIEEREAPAASHETLFGEPSPVLVRRVDSAHREIPRPHFLQRGDQTGVSGRKTTPPQMPEPELTDPPKPDRPRKTGTTKRTRPANPPGRVAPAMPVRPAAELSSEPVEPAPVAETVEDAPEASKPTRPRKKRIVRIDSGHPMPGNATARATGDNSAADADQSAPPRPKLTRPKVTAVTPSPTVTEGFDVLDRALSSVPRKQS